MEIKEMNIEEIEARSAEILKEMESEGADLDALLEEARSLNERKAELEKIEAERKEEARKIADGQKGIVEKKMEEPKLNEKELRAKEFVDNGRMEMRALLGTGNIAKPTQAGGVNDIANLSAGIVDDVNAIALNGYGAWVSAYSATNAAAADVTDGSNVGGTEATFHYVTINPSEWGIHSEISKQVAKLTPVDYMSAIENQSLRALRSKANAKIITAVLASDLLQTKADVALDENFLRNVMLSYNPIDGKGETVLYLCQADLATLGAVRGNDKKPVYEIVFDQGTVQSGVLREGGLATKFRVDATITTGTQLFGQPLTIDMPMWNGYEVATDEGGEYFKKNVIGIRGLQTAGADLCAKNGMMKITQPAGAAQKSK